MQEELNTLRRDLAASSAEGKRQLDSSRAAEAEAKKQADDRLAIKIAELEKAREEVEKRLEAEKDEMMDAMAQEVEELEATKNAEVENLQREKDALKADLEKSHDDKSKAEKRADELNRGKHVLKNEVLKLKKKWDAATKTLKDLRKQTETEVNTMRALVLQQLGPKGPLNMKIKEVTVELGKQVDVITGKYHKEMRERKKLHNVIQDLKGSIRVYLRCRPPSSREIAESGTEANCVSFPGDGEVKVTNEKSREKTWEFDEVFNHESTQEAIYEEVSGLVTSVLDGYNVCIFAYGQTGSGKTYTMGGPVENRGVNTRALQDLFAIAQERTEEFNTTITVSMLEVYNEDIRDLLKADDGGDKLEVRQGEFGNHVPGLTMVAVEEARGVFDLFGLADRNRSQTATNMNEHSSRSHMMLTVHVVSEHRATGAVSRGKLNLVDLAGSERINKSGATGQALKEAQNINKSLSALGDVIAARAARQAHIPFRNSTLTYLLQDSLSQDSKTLMFVCISPIMSSAEETFCSLNFAARVRTVELGKAAKHTAAAAPVPAAGTAGGGAAPKAAPNRRASMAGGKY